MNSKKPLKSNSVLVGKTKFKASKPITAKPKKHTITWYKKEARKWFNRSVKYRDSSFVNGEWVFKCITCSRPVLFKDRVGHFHQSAHAGHFQPETRGSTRFNEMNVNGQCHICNSFNAGEQIKYARELDLKYGDGTAAELERLAHIPHQFTAEELIEVIKDAKEQITWYESEIGRSNLLEVK